MSQNEDDISGYSKFYKEAAPYVGLGVQLAATVVIMFFVGNWLDNKLNFYPVLTLIFSFFGIGAGLYNFIKTVINIGKENEKNEK